MRIGAPAAPVLPPTRERKVEAQRTPVTRAELRAAIGRALERTSASKPPAELVDVLTAQASLETASGASMYNFNFGGIKGHAPDGGTASLRTHEVLGGKDVVIRDGFRAYASLDEGARDFVTTMKTRFAGAVDAASRGDVAGFASALKRSGYYTASETDYARGLASLMRTPAGAVSATTRSASSCSPMVSAPAFGLTSAGLARVGDALDGILIEVEARRAEGQVVVDDAGARAEVLGHGEGDIVRQGRGADAALGPHECQGAADEGGGGVGVEAGDGAHQLQRVQRRHEVFAHAPAHQLAIQADVVGLPDHHDLGARVADLG